MNSTKKNYNLVLISMFIAIILVLASTPFGFIPLLMIKATTIHIPVIVGSIILGSKSGALLGFIFGLTSVLSSTFSPHLLSFAFSPFIPVPGTERGNYLSLIVCFLPRILTGIIPYLVFNKLSPKIDQKISIFIASVVGSLTNTILVLNLIYLLFNQGYAQIKGLPLEKVYTALMALVFINGIPEALIAGIICTFSTSLILNFRKTP